MNLIRALMDQAKPVIRLRRRLLGPKRPSWNEDFETIATVLRSSADFSVLLPLDVQRRVIDPKRPDSPVVRETTITDVSVNGLPGQWFVRPDSRHDRVVVYLHGGGYSVGSMRSHRDLIARIARSTRAKVLAVDYRLAPEHPFPAQIEDALATYRFLLEQGFPPERIAIAGESAGGGLTMATLLTLREKQLPMPATAVLISPWVDLEATGASFEENRRYDFVTRRAMQAYAKRFVPKHQLRNPLAAPVHAELHGLPPVLVQVGEVETLRDDGVKLAKRIEESGGRVTLEVWPDMIHAFHVFAGMLPVAQQAIDRLAEYVEEQWGEA